MLLETKCTILEMIARGADLRFTLEELCRHAEAVAPDVTCSVETLQGERLAAPSLPVELAAALAAQREKVRSPSFSTDWSPGPAVVASRTEMFPRWPDYEAIALPFGYTACCSSPIEVHGNVIATFTFHYRNPRMLSADEREVMRTCVQLCTIALERNDRVQERQRLAYTDPLTGLPNRAQFGRALAGLEPENPLSWALLLLDLDNLKLVNDTFGHAAGDDLIKIVAERLAQAAQPEPVFRLGGDEFAVLISGERSDDLPTMAGKLLMAVKQPAECSGHKVLPSGTIGGAVAESGHPVNEIRQKADIALYHAKERNRGGYAGYRDDMGSVLVRRFQAIRDVTAALNEDRLVPYYQPIVRLDTEEVVGFGKPTVRAALRGDAEHRKS